MAGTVAELFNFENAVFSSFAFCSTAALLKLIAMGMLTGFLRVTKGVYANEEDCKAFAPKDKKNDGAQLKPNFSDSRVERVRRNHLNDVENIIPFVLVGLLYITTSPVATTAILHFRIFLASRFVHTLSYQFALQPFRALAHFTSIGVIISMGVQVLRVTTF